MHDEEFRNQFADSLTGEPAEEADSLRSLWMKLDSLPRENADSPAMRARFDAMLDGYREGMERGSNVHSGRISWWIRRWRPLQPALQLGIALVLVFAGLIAGRYLSFGPAPRQQGQDLDQLRGELRDLREMITLSLLQQQSATERLRGVGWSNQIDQPDSKVITALLDTLMHDSNVNVRLASVEALKKFGEKEVVRRGALEALEQQESPLIQVALIDFMVGMQERESIGTLQRLAGDSRVNEMVRKRAALGVEDFQQRGQ